MKSYTKFVLLLSSCFLCLLFPKVVNGQCYFDTGKHTCFEYPGVVAKIQFFGPFGYETRDFFYSILNPNVFSQKGNRVNGNIWTQVTLTADDPSFVYINTCVNKNAQGQCVGIYKFEPVFFNPYTQTERWLGHAVNMVGTVFPACESGQTFIWRGTVKIESIEKALPWDQSIIVNVQPFYSFSPLKASAPLGSGQSACKAYKTAWQAFDVFADVSYDGDIQRLVVPYANFWHNDTVWEKGWQTVVVIRNFTGTRVTYTIENHLSDGSHGGTHAAAPPCNPSAISGPCVEANDCEIETSVTLENGQSRVIDAFRFHVPDTVRTSHDTVLFIKSSPLLGGTQPAVRIFPNLSGSPCQQ
jgi:hypothetical protein